MGERTEITIALAAAAACAASTAAGLTQAGWQQVDLAVIATLLTFLAGLFSAVSKKSLA